MTALGQRATEEQALADHLFMAVCDRASGRGEDECLRNYPRDVYFIGNFRPRDEAREADVGDPPHFAEMRSKIAPVATGLEFLLRLGESDASIEVTVAWNCYYRAMPTLQQQRGHQSSYPGEPQADVTAASSSDQSRSDSPSLSAADPGTDDATEDEAEPQSPEATQTPMDRRQRRSPHDSLFIRFKKISCRVTESILVRHLNGVASLDASRLQAAVNTELARAASHAALDPDRVRTLDQPHTRIEVPVDALRSDRDYAAFVASLIREVSPSWGIELLTETRPNEGTNRGDWILRIELLNTSPRLAGADGRDNPNVEPFLFDVRARLRIEGGLILPFEIELAPRGFRYDRSLWGRGFNCAVEFIKTPSLVLETTHTPVHRQGRHSTRVAPSARFADLASSPLGTLDTIRLAMEDYLRVWSHARSEYAAAGGWDAGKEAEFTRDQNQFESEIERFKLGIRILSTDADALEAFRLTNETFRQAGQSASPEKRKDSWRLFQIVFVVGQIPGIWALAHPTSPEAAQRELVDIIYFPTGGGKTEAYLGTIVFHCFFDRLRGKACGTAVWTRFPLRLLTLQQTQRVADVLGLAELIRRKSTDVRLSGPDASEFAVGYFVGKEGTPNEILNPNQYQYANEEAKVTWSQATDARARQAWKRVARCPSCKTNTIAVDFELASVRLIHRCTNPSCAFTGGQLPCYIVDNEIFRYLPSVIVGTIDKLAGLGNQRKFAQMFGQVDGRCSVHGFYKGKCNQKDCADRTRLRAGVPKGLSGPTLFVQDELHLLKEGLGTFDSHYESFAHALRREFGQQDTLKIIASSATIEAFERQVQHLYGRQPGDAVVFPGPGPSLNESFYAFTEALETQRLYVGILPHNKTIFNAVLELIEFYHHEVQALARLPQGSPNPYAGQVRPASSEWQKLLDSYLTSVTYFLSGRDLNSIRTDVTGHVNPSLVREGLLPIELHELTGETDSDEVSRVLQILETPDLGGAAPRGVLATNMISHGVDVDRLNAMIFYGMPRQTAEYIQASSRVGRSHVGIVFCCLHPIRERDRSHYTYFAKYHEFLGQLVEPVAINRWATFGAQRTLPGLFMGVLLQLLANRAGGRDIDRHYMLSHVKQKIADGTLRHADFIPILESTYLVLGGDATGLATFRAEIAQRVPQFFDQIVTAGADIRFVSEVLIPAPMTSLRDVDEPVTIELDASGSQWAAL
ncbi:MAG TPA: helicase-related protein [Terracidiphilus sp.]|jgi:hypothetical protein